MKMHFGKFKVLNIALLPKDYLTWLATIDLNEPLRSGVASDLHRRAASQPDIRRQYAAAALDIAKVKKISGSWRLNIILTEPAVTQASWQVLTSFMR